MSDELNPDLFEDFEDDLEELDMDEEDLEDIEEMFLEDESEDSEAQPAPNTNNKPPTARWGAYLFYLHVQLPQSHPSVSSVSLHIK